MPEKGKLPEWEKEDNKVRIFKLIVEKASSFKELLEQTKFSTATLTKHLKTLQEEEAIEKAIVKGKVVYRMTLNEEALLSELKSMQFDVLLKLLSTFFPTFVEQWQTNLRNIAKEMVRYLKDVVEHGEEEALKRLEKRRSKQQKGGEPLPLKLEFVKGE